MNFGKHLKPGHLSFLALTQSHMACALHQPMMDAFMIGPGKEPLQTHSDVIPIKPILLTDIERESTSEDVMITLIKQTLWEEIQSLPTERKLQALADSFERDRRPPNPFIIKAPDAIADTLFIPNKTHHERSHPNQPFYAKFQKNKRSRR